MRPAESPRDAIAALVHRYSDAISRRDVNQWASCWAANGRWEIRDDLVGTDDEGRLAMLRRAFDVLDGVFQMTANGSVTDEGNGTASGRWYIVEYTRRVTGRTGLLLGHYDDRYVQEGGHWLFAARTLVRDYDGPPDLTGPFGR